MHFYILTPLFEPRSLSSSTWITIPGSCSFLKTVTFPSWASRSQQLLQAKEKSTQLDGGDSGFPPCDDGGGGGRGGGGGNWSGGFFLFG
ncbi:uncharacterized protein LOC120127895 isoform X2 [Hibiscus syriacus]|uniref:uncharacterized protein LOC120127895 isoform X2 n=1 Tax=Hibiscus syriacus TaxID=106335 RepID=UPI0019229DFF|nr:uncharacterized protein LOC120127895 isoform X2 [Hibiscus syriacus]